MLLSLFKLEVVLKPPRRAIHRLREIPAETVEFQILGLMQGKYDEFQSQRESEICWFVLGHREPYNGMEVGTMSKGIIGGFDPTHTSRFLRFES